MSDRPEYKAAWYQKNKERVREKRRVNQQRYLAKPEKREKRRITIKKWRDRQKQNEFS